MKRSFSAEFAIISDIHGNTWALDSVIADIKRRKITSIINLGDIVHGPLDPRGTAEQLMALEATMNIVTIRGNHDRSIAQGSTPGSSFPIHEYVASQLTNEQAQWLDRMPPSRVVEDELFLCHGTPEDDETYLLEKVTKNGVSLRPREEIEFFLKDIPCTITLCGHSHIPRTVLLSDNRLAINPGSVGLQAFTEERPFPHRMHTDSPHARYVVLSKTTEGWNAEHVKIPYDWETAAGRARENHRDDWAKWILHGRP